MDKKQYIGKLGEDLSAKFLIDIGYEILDRNFHSTYGEIDIIAKNEKYVVFVEVKTRSNVLFGTPIEAVNRKKQKRMYKTAKYYLCRNNLVNSFIRFDVIEVYILEKSIKINHIKQIM